MLLSRQSRRRTPIKNPKSKIQSLSSNATLAKKVASSCQILAKLGLFKETTGHVSARTSDGKGMLIRGRGRDEKGLLLKHRGDFVASGSRARSVRRRSSRSSRFGGAGTDYRLKV
jgi:hypothetical protein